MLETHFYSDLWLISCKNRWIVGCLGLKTQAIGRCANLVWITLIGQTPAESRYLLLNNYQTVRKKTSLVLSIVYSSVKTLITSL